MIFRKKKTFGGCNCKSQIFIFGYQTTARETELARRRF